MKIAFTDKDRKAVEEAVAHLERETAGELVPVVVTKSDEYPEVKWRLASFSAAATTVFLGLASYLWLIPAPISVAVACTVIFFASLLGFIIPILFPITRRWLTPFPTREARAIERAETAFLQHEVFATRERIGILLFVSLLEREVVVLADTGISAKVPDTEWETLADELIVGLKKKQAANGFVTAINHSRELLLKHGFTHKPDAGNQLPNQLRIED